MADPTIAASARLLADLTAERPWMTARGLVRKLAASGHGDVTPDELERQLIRHAQSPGRLLRHSHYPSRQTLDLLWGHVDVVGEKGNLAELHRLDAPYAGSPPVPDGAPWMFLSHGHRDLSAAVELQRILATHGIGAWLFEAEIPEGGQIAGSVRGAVHGCDGFLAYVSRRSLGSLWIQKEMAVAKRAGQRDPLLVIDGADAELRRLFASWTGAWPPESEGTQAFAALSAAAVGAAANSAWTRRCVEFMHSLNEFVMSTGRILAFPAVPESALEEWEDARLQVASITADGPLPDDLSPR